VGALAEGLGIRAVARVFAVDPHTVLQWLVEAAGQAAALSRYFLHDVHVRQVQLDELFGVLSAVKTGEGSEAEAIERLERSPHWVWVAMDPESKLLLSIDVGERTLATAQRVVHQIVQVLAPDCAPLLLTDGFKEYTTALLTHYGQRVQPARQWAQGPAPKPRWLPLPQLLYARVVKQYRRRRLVRVRHRVVFGTLAAVEQVLAPLGWQINTAFIERVNLTIRQHVAARATRHHVLQTRSGLTPAAGPLSRLSQFLLAAYQLTRTLATARADPRQRLRQGVAPLFTGHSRGADRPHVDPAPGALISRAALAAASGCVSGHVWLPF
jgi:IS1 family transposase